jgi:hypothetical protein
MKNVKIGKYGLIILLTLFTIPVVKSLGITGAIPSDIRMLRGDSAEIKFQVQAISSLSDVSCTIDTEDFEPIIFNFKDTPVKVPAGTAKYVYGTVTIPNNAEIKTYSGKIYAKCSPDIESEGSGSVITQTMGAKYSLQVVATEAERNIRPLTRTISEEETKAIPTSTVITVIIILILVAIVVYAWLKRNKKKK